MGLMPPEGRQTDTEAPLGSWVSRIHPVLTSASLAGRGTGYAVRAARLLRFPWFRKQHTQAILAFEETLRRAILAEVQRTGLQFSDAEIEELVEKVLTLLERVFSGELGVGAIPSAADLLRAGSVFAEYLAPLIRGDEDLSESKKEMLRRILEENIQLRQETEAAGNTP